MSTRAKSKTSNQTAPHAIEKQTGSGNSSAGNAPANEEIQLRAYCIHVERGGQHGCDLDDWFQAERELTEYPAGPSGSDGARRGWITSVDADDWLGRTTVLPRANGFGDDKDCLLTR